MRLDRQGNFDLQSARGGAGGEEVLLLVFDAL